MGKDRKQKINKPDPAPAKGDKTKPLPTERDQVNMVQSSKHSVFLIDDSFYRSRTPKSSHWSIAWADLMMTMFVLFLTLFIYQLAHREFLKEDRGSVVAGSTIKIPTLIAKSKPFIPILPTISAKKGIVIKQSAPSPEPEPPPITPGPQSPPNQLSMPLPDSVISQEQQIDQNKPATTEPAATPVDIAFQSAAAKNTPPEKTIVEPQPLQGQIPKSQEIPAKKDNELIAEIYDLSKYTFINEKLEKFASVELIPDKTVRIILTGDLLFPSGKAELTETAKESLSKLAPIIRQTPYMINVVGHTDSVPMHSAQFPTNWELSVVRASRVARFLIENIGIPSEQFIISGYSYHRPIRPNDTEKNKRANRRVEIIISKEPLPVKPYEENTIFN